MIIIDRALEAREAEGRPIRVGLIGAGALGRGIIRQYQLAARGQRLVAVSNRTPQRAIDAWTDAGAETPEVVDDLAALDRAIDAGRPVVTSDPMLLCSSERIDAIIEATGTLDLGAEIAMAAIEHGKHVFINAELEATVGIVLNDRAKAAGVVVSALDGDQPGTQLNLYRFAQGMGFEPLVCGNIKGLQDHYRTPDTQVAYAAEWGLTPHMAASFADGSKISFEQAVVALSTGMGVARRGMIGIEYDGHVDDLVGRYDVDEVRAHGGIVDWVLGSKPSPGVFVFVAQPDAKQRAHMRFAKLGEGPLYSFYAPYHLTHMEAPHSVARAVLFGDATTSPTHPTVEVIAIAKRDLVAGEVLDGLGGFHTYGTCEDAVVARDEALLPMGVAEGCRLIRDVPKDAAVRRTDVELPAGRLLDSLRAEQDLRHDRVPVVAAATSAVS